MRKVAIVGGGLSKWGVRNATWKELVQEAGKAVFNDVQNLDKKDIDSLFVGAAMPERLAFQSYVAPMVAEQLGLTPSRMIMRAELACASGQVAIRAAYASIASGLSEIALVLGAEKMNLPNLAETQSSLACVLDREWDGVNGASAPPFFALTAQRHMYEYGTTREQLALVSVKNHDFSATNPFAHFQKRFTVEKVINSPMIAPPLRLLDCSGITDGAAAVILTSEEKAREFTDTPIWIKGMGQSAMGNLVSHLRSLTTWYPLREASREGLKMAGIGIQDVDLAEVHDCFTISEIIIYEDLGLCEKGQGGRFIEEGQSNIGGKLPVNTRGGLLGCGHPLGATGIAQAIELMQQFKAQVPKERYVGGEIGLTHNLSGNANVHSVMIYGRGG